MLFLVVTLQLPSLIEIIMSYIWQIPRKHRYGKMGAVPVPGTSWVRIPPGYRYMRTLGVPIFGQKKNFRYGFGIGRVGSNTGRAKTAPFKVNLKVKYLFQNLLNHSISLLCNAARLLLCNAARSHHSTVARSLSLHRQFSPSHFLLYRQRATDLLCSRFSARSPLRISSMLSIRPLLYGLHIFW